MFAVQNIYFQIELVNIIIQCITEHSKVSGTQTKKNTRVHFLTRTHFLAKIVFFVSFLSQIFLHDLCKK